MLGGPEVAPVRTIRQWVEQGRLKAYKPGKHLLFREADVVAFVEGRDPNAASTTAGRG